MVKFKIRIIYNNSLYICVKYCINMYPPKWLILILLLFIELINYFISRVNEL